MVSLSHSINIWSDGSLSAVAQPIETNLFRVKHDWEFLGGKGLIAPRTKKPEVYTLHNNGCEFTEQLQWLSFRLFWWGAPSLPQDLAISRWTALYGEGKAFANKTGFGGLPPRKNHINGDNLNNKDAINPDLDKDRVCGGATVRGVIERNVDFYNYIFEPSHKEIMDVVWIETLDPDNLLSFEELITKPWLYFHATVAYEKKAGAFPHGQQPELGIWEPTLVPLVSKHKVGWPLDYLDPVLEIADPYRFGG